MTIKTQEAHVTVKIGKQTFEKTVPAGQTEVNKLKAELAVPATSTLYLIHGNQRRVLGDQEHLDVESGMHFEAVEGGGVS